MYQRLLAPHLRRLSNQYPVITVTGPRQSGKTTLCKSEFPDYAYANMEDISVREFANHDPKGFLAQFPDGVILDEIQRVPNITSQIQLIVDAEQRPGRFILTGSQQFEVMNSVNQSLAGRTALLKLLPLSYEELYGLAPPSDLSTLLYSGFYPRIYDRGLNPTEALSFYLSTYVERDIRTLINIKDISTFERFLKICASQVGQLLNYSSIANDCGIDQKTVKSWLSVLEASYIIFQVQPHFKNFRKRLTKSSKLYFYDIGLACNLLGITQANHLLSHPLKGQLFENFIVTEFVKNRFNNVRTSNIYFFRDHVGNEVDLILDQGNALYSVEIKSSSTMSQDFIKGLKSYHQLAGPQNSKRFIIYSGNESYNMNDVQVISYQKLGALFENLNQE